MTADAQLDRPVDRRFLIRGGAVLAGAAGATVLGAALNPTKANAADGDELIIGASNAGETNTSLTIGGATGSAEPTLTLANVDGPSLALSPVGTDFDETDLGLGEIANSEEGPWIGVDYGAGTVTTYLATGIDLDSVPVTFPVGPERVLDTRTAVGRTSIVGRSAALDASFRLRAGNWIDVALLSDDGSILVDGAFFNLTVARPATSGYLTAYTPDTTRPLASTLNFLANANLSNSAYVRPELVSETWAVRIYASQTTHVVLDLTGLTSAFVENSGVTAAKASARVARRQARQAKLRTRLAKSVSERASR